MCPTLRGIGVHVSKTHCLGASGSGTKLGMYLSVTPVEVNTGRGVFQGKVEIDTPITNSSVAFTLGIGEPTATPVTSWSLGSSRRLLAFRVELSSGPSEPQTASSWTRAATAPPNEVAGRWRGAHAAGPHPIMTL